MSANKSPLIRKGSVIARAEDMPNFKDELFIDAIREVTQTVKVINENVDMSLARVESTEQEVKARLTAIEQHVVSLPTEVGAAYGPANILAHEAVETLQADPGFAHLQAWNQGTCRVQLPGLSLRAALVNEGNSLSTDSGMPSQPGRSGIFGKPVAPARLLDVLPSRTTDRDAVEFIQVRTDDNPEIQKREGQAKKEMEFSGSLRRANIITLAGWTPASRQVLSDHAALLGVIDNTLRAKLRNRFCYELLNGNPSSAVSSSGGGQDGHIDGLLNQAAVLGDPQMVHFADQVGEGIVALNGLGYDPDVICVHPDTWLVGIATAKTTTEHAYLFGSPTAPVPPALWNRRVVLEPSMTRGQALLIDTDYVSVLDREQPSIMLSNSHSDFFIKNMVAILGEMRGGLEVRDQFALLLVGADADVVSSS